MLTCYSEFPFLKWFICYNSTKRADFKWEILSLYFGWQSMWDFIFIAITFYLFYLFLTALKVCISLHTLKYRCKKHADYALNCSRYSHPSKHRYCWIRELSIKARSNICLELSGLFKTNLSAYDRDPWNQIQLIPPLNSTL